MITPLEREVHKEIVRGFLFEIANAELNERFLHKEITRKNILIENKDQQKMLNEMQLQQTNIKARLEKLRERLEMARELWGDEAFK